MTRVILIILLSFTGLNLKAETNVDSLWRVWSNETLSDTARLVALNEFIDSVVVANHLDSADNLSERMLQYATAKGDRLFQGRAYSRFADIHIKRSEYLEANKDLFQAVDIFREVGHKEELAGVYWDLGLTYWYMGQYSKSLENYSRSLSLTEELGQSTSGLLNNIGLIYNIQKDYPKAMEYFQRSAKVAEENGKVNAVAIHNIGDVHLAQGNFEKALECFNKRLQQAEEKKGPYYNCHMSSIMSSLGDTYKKMNDNDLAMEYFMRALEHHKKDSACYGFRAIEIDIGSLYARMGKSDLAIEWCSKGYDKTKEANALGFQLSACNCLFRTYKGLGDDSKALEYLELTNLLNDSLDKEATTKSLQQMEYAKLILADSLKQEEEKLKMTIAHNEEVREKEKARNIYLGSGLILLLLAIGLHTRNRFVSRAKAEVEKEKKRSDELLLNILPEAVAEELKEKGEAEAQLFDEVTVIFTDFKGFTALSEQLSPKDLVRDLNECFSSFDSIIGKHGIEKIKTIGDSYMCVGGLPVPDENVVMKSILAGLEMQAFMTNRKVERDTVGLPSFEMRVGIHTGPVVAGIVGVKKFQYDIWGDTVNIASRIESAGEVGKVNISQATYDLLKSDPDFVFASRGKIEAKGKGEIEMYFVSKA